MADLVRKLIAVGIVLRALTNFGKPFSAGSTVIAPLFGVLMLVYAWGLWHARPWAWPLGIAYAVWATANVVLFPLLEGVPPQFAPWMYALFAVPGIVIPWLAVWLVPQGRAA
jgi:hypothetical protein